MSGRIEGDILAQRQREINKIYEFANNNNIEVNIIYSYINDETRDTLQRCMNNVKNWDIYWLGRAIEELSKADVLWLCDGWEQSKGCNIELECAISYGLEISYPPERRNNGE